MPLRADLRSQARDFAGRLTDLLNRTICDGPRLKTVMQEDGEVGWVGYKITKDDPFIGEAIPVAVGRKPRVYLHISQALELDSEGSFLKVRASNYDLCLDPTLETVVLHYDFNREPGNPYPDAHVQVHGESVAFADLCNRTGVDMTLGRLQIPVGGRRYRPSVEDVIEMLIVEGFAEPRDERWPDILAEHRKRWHEMQLKSVVRREPEIAAEELRRQGWTVTPPLK